MIGRQAEAALLGRHRSGDGLQAAGGAHVYLACREGRADADGRVANVVEIAEQRAPITTRPVPGTGGTAMYRWSCWPSP